MLRGLGLYLAQNARSGAPEIFQLYLRGIEQLAGLYFIFSTLIYF